MDLKFTWKMEGLFLVIVKTDATTARMSPPFHRGKMTGKAKGKKNISLGANKPLFSSAKQTGKDIIFLPCVQVLLTKI